jgi:putative ABC transport system permease protein
MIKNYFKVAWRNITKHPFYSIVNIVGLFAGISFSLLIGAYIWSELQVNRQLKNFSQQYILTTVSTDPNIGYELATFGPLAKRLKEDYPNLVANYYRYDGITSIVSKEDKHFREGLQVGDSTLLKMFGFKTLYGDIQTALNDPYSVVITEDKAIKYFGRTDVIGELVSIQSFSGGDHAFKITAVLKEPSKNSIMNLTKDYPNSFFVPINAMSYFGRGDVESWGNMSIASFIELKNGITSKDLQKPLQQIMEQNVNADLNKVITVKPVLLTDYYLQQDKGLVKRMLYTLSFVGLFILLMAIVNFINIAVSRSGSRMKEIGIRKVLGGLRKQLILQFLMESTVLVFGATVFAIAAYPFLQSFFKQIVGKELPALTSFPFYFIFLALALILVIGALAGLYPALVLSAMRSADSIKGKFKTGKEKIFLRKSLVGFQFGTALIVLIAAGVVTHQVSYFFSRNLGYNKEYIVSSQVPRDWSEVGVRKMEIIRNEFAQMPEVSNVSLSYEIPNGNNGGQGMVYKSGSDSAQATAMQILSCDAYYLSTYEIKLKAGNFLETNGNVDSSKIVLNEKAVKVLGWKNNNDALNQLLRIPGDNTVYTVLGVAGNFHFASMQEEIQPFIFMNNRRTNSYRFLSFKIKPGNISSATNSIQKKWAQLLPGSSFEYMFMDDTLKKMYATELQLKKAAYSATILALIIVLLGVLGLVSLSIHRRIKEIGVRKVLGASLTSIIVLFIKEFAVILIIAILVACPFAWYLMKDWLENYAYRINISSQPFIIAILLVSLITLLLIALQVISTIRRNVIKSLKTE